MTHEYRDPDDEEGFLYVREWSDRRLVDEFEFLSALYAVAASEVAFRADNPEHRDGSADILAGDVELYALADTVNGHSRTPNQGSNFVPPHVGRD